MSIEITAPDIRSGSVTVAVGGDIDLGTVPVIHAQVDALLAEDGVTGLLLDLSGVTFLDSSGIGALIGCLRKAEQQGKSFRVENAHGLVLDVLNLTNVLPLLTGRSRDLS
jgi:anti-sigma B factor antagonist